MVLALSAAFGLVELVCWSLVGLGCVGAVYVACYGGSNGIPAAPGYHLGVLLADLAAGRTIAVAITSLLGVLGVTPIRRRVVVAGASVLLVLAAAAWAAAESVFKETPPARWCLTHIGTECVND